MGRPPKRPSALVRVSPEGFLSTRPYAIGGQALALLDAHGGAGPVADVDLVSSAISAGTAVRVLAALALVLGSCWAARRRELGHLGGRATTADVMARLGHTTPAMAMVYQHSLAGADARVANALSHLGTEHEERSREAKGARE